MKQRFISKRKKKKTVKLKFLFFACIFIYSLYFTFSYLLKSNLKVDDKVLVQLMLNDTYKNNLDIFSTIIDTIKKTKVEEKLLMTSYYKLDTKKNQKDTVKTLNTTENNDYQIYIYNTHQTEEYASNTFLEQQVKPTVMMSSYIMQDVFNKNNYKTLVEERRIKDILNENNWKYYRSYDASRIYLNDVKEKNKSIKYFIDVHRDSLSKDRTTVSINDKSYAKMIFLLGRENPNYQENLEFITKINNKVVEKYPNLSKGIYQKEGTGVNGVYNQDNSKYTILVEIGGPDNTTDEVLNTTLAFCECFMEVINSNEG